MTSKRIKVKTGDWESASYGPSSKATTDSSWLKNPKKKASKKQLKEGRTLLKKNATRNP